MARTTWYLTADDIVEIHDIEVGPTGVDLDGVKGAAGRPQQTFDGQDLYPSLHEKAAALAHGLATTQYFTDGNKRTALLAMDLFFKMNGYRTTADNVEMFHLLEDIATNRMTQEELCARLRAMYHGPPDDFE